MKAEKVLPVVDMMNMEQMNHNLRYNMEGTLMVIWQIYPSWKDRMAMCAGLAIFCQSVFIPALREMKDDLDLLFRVCMSARELVYEEKKREQNVRPVLTVVRTESDPE